MRTHAFVGALVPDPIEWAETFGPAFGLAETFRHAGAPEGDPVVGLAAPDCTLALYRLAPEESMVLWGFDHLRPRMHVLGLGVPDLDSAMRILTDEGIGVVRRTEQAIVLRSVDSGEVPVVLVGDLLEGDPRQAGRDPWPLTS